MDIKIPEILHTENFRFLFLTKKSKVPKEKKWEIDANYKYDDEKLLKHLENGGNYGILAGPGNLRILDIDDKKLAEEILNKQDSEKLYRKHGS